MGLVPASPIHPSEDKKMVLSSPEGGDNGEKVDGSLELEGVDDANDDGYNTETEPARTSGGAQSNEEHSTPQKG